MPPSAQTLSLRSLRQLRRCAADRQLGSARAARPSVPLSLREPHPRSSSQDSLPFASLAGSGSSVVLLLVLVPSDPLSIAPSSLRFAGLCREPCTALSLFGGPVRPVFGAAAPRKFLVKLVFCFRKAKRNAFALTGVCFFLGSCHVCFLLVLK